MPRFCFQRANLWLEGYFMSSVAAATKLSKSEPSVHWYLNHHSSLSLSVTLVCILHSWLTYTCDGPKFTTNIKNGWDPDPAYCTEPCTGLLHTGTFTGTTGLTFPSKTDHYLPLCLGELGFINLEHWREIAQESWHSENPVPVHTNGTAKATGTSRPHWGCSRIKANDKEQPERKKIN